MTKQLHEVVQPIFTTLNSSHLTVGGSRVSKILTSLHMVALMFLS